SNTSGDAARFASRSDCTAARTAASLRPLMSTWAPLAAMARAMLSPRPRADPVISATCPASEKFCKQDCETDIGTGVQLLNSGAQCNSRRSSQVTQEHNTMLTLQTKVTAANTPVPLRV